MNKSRVNFSRVGGSIVGSCKVGSCKVGSCQSAKLVTIESGPVEGKLAQNIYDKIFRLYYIYFD